jgi:hypothetical protein
MYLISSSYVEVLDEAYTGYLDGAGTCETMDMYLDKYKLQRGSEDQSIPSDWIIGQQYFVYRCKQHKYHILPSLWT